MLAQAGMNSTELNGYERQEPSRKAVAQAIAGDSADAGLGIEAAAQEKVLSLQATLPW